MKMKKICAVVISFVMLLMCCVPAFAAEKTITAPADGYAGYDRAEVARNDAAVIDALSYDQIASLLLDWADRNIAAAAGDFNAFAASVGVDVQITGIDSLLLYKDHIAELGGDFANLDVSALNKTRADGDINLIYSVFEFMAANADTFGKVFRWDGEVFDYGKVGEFIESEQCADQNVKNFYRDYLKGGNIQEKFVAEIAREMNYEIPKNGEERTETFDLTISNGIKAWFLGLLGDMLSEESKAAVNAMDLRTEDVYSLVKQFVGLLQNDYKAQLDELLEGFFTALKGMVQVIAAGVNVEPPVVEIGDFNDVIGTYHPASTDLNDYMPVIYTPQNYIDMVDGKVPEGITVKADTELPELVKENGTEMAGGFHMTVNGSVGENVIDEDIRISFEDIEALITSIAGTVEEESAMISNIRLTFDYKGYSNESQFIAELALTGAVADVTYNGMELKDLDLMDPGSNATVNMIDSMSNGLASQTINTAVSSFIKTPVATVVVSNLSGTVEELEQIETLMSYIDTEAGYDYGLLDVAANYDEYKGAVGQLNRILYGLADMICTDAGMEDLGLVPGGNEHLYENLRKICEKVSALLDTMKEYIDRDTFVALAGNAGISDVFASAHGFNAGMIYDMDFSSVENALDCGIRVACDLLAEDDPDSIFFEFHMSVEELDTLDAIAAATADMLLGKVLDGVELEGWDYEYAPIDAEAVDNGAISARDAIMGKVTDIFYYAAGFAADKINSAANEAIRTFTEKTGITLGAFELGLGVEKSENWEETLGALADRFIELTDGLFIPAGEAKEQNSLLDKLTVLAGILPMNSIFSNYSGLTAMDEAFFDKALDGDLGDFLSYFEVKDDVVAGDVPVTKALINASDYIVDNFFPDTVQAELYEPAENVQETFTGAESDQGIAARNMVSINERKAHLVPALFDLLRESGMLPGFACNHANVTEVEEVASTCQQKGHAAGKKCADCGAVIEGCEEYELAGHKYTVLTETKAATCTAGGYKVFKCEYCSATEKRSRTGALGHDYQNGECSRCGQPDPNYEPAGPEEPGEPENPSDSGSSFLSFWQRIVSFFRRIAEFFRGLFNR